MLLDRENLIAVLADSYVFRQALEAKNFLIDECTKLSLSDSIKEFTKTPQEAKSAAALRRVVTDAVDIWSVVDREKAGKFPVKFVAANPNHLPNVKLKKFNVQFLKTSIQKI